MSSVLIIFGSTSGNTELVTDKVTEVLTNNGHNVTVKRAELINPGEINKYKVCVFASSTYGQGILQDHMARFLWGASNLNLKGKKCAVIGLGDNKYNTEYVVEAAKILDNKVKDLGGEQVIQPLRINKTPVPHLNKSIKDWATKLSKAIK